MSGKWSPTGLIARGVALGGEGGARLAGWNASFGAGLSLLLDEEGETAGPLLRVLAGEVAPSAGTVRWGGADVADWRERSPEGLFWRDPRAPWPEISPERWATELAARYPAWREDDWQRHVQGLALQEHLRKEMFRLSTGSKRKVLLAVALASGAPLTLLDEPEAALDHASIRYLRGALGEEARRAGETGRVWVVGNYEPMAEVPWVQVISV
ncbi:MAG: ATP-binding cassette domain-containing protein [Comamonas sp.]|nr:ATP-binding cassette domain-containing protein [Comamonas sp.]